MKDPTPGWITEEIDKEIVETLSLAAAGYIGSKEGRKWPLHLSRREICEKLNIAYDGVTTHN